MTINEDDIITVWTWYWGQGRSGLQEVTGKVHYDWPQFPARKSFSLCPIGEYCLVHMEIGVDCFFTREEAIQHRYEQFLDDESRAIDLRQRFEEKYIDSSS